MATILERKFEKQVCSELLEMFPGAVLLKLDPLYIQGIPDRLILFGERWASLEIKRLPTSHKQPNQEFYIKKLNNMSYASFLNIKNKELVYDRLQRLLGQS